MYDFLVSGTNERGKQEAVHVRAETSQEAYEVVEGWGFTDITLHTDDAAAAGGGRLTALEEGAVTPAEMVEYRTISATRFFLLLMNKLHRQLAWPLLVLAAFCFYSWWQTGEIGPWGPILAVVLMLPRVLSFWAAFLGDQRRFEKMLNSLSWARWEEALQMLPSLKGEVPDFELDICRACALAGLGRLEEGLTTVEKHAHSEATPHWMYYNRLAEVYESAKMHDKSLDCLRQSYEAAPDNPTAKLDYAFGLLKAEKNLDLAQQLIESAESQHLSDILVMFLPYIKGLAALNARKHAEAVALLRSAETELRPLAARVAMIGESIDRCAAYLAIALANVGELCEAERLFEKARPRLEALNADRLIQRYRNALG